MIQNSHDISLNEVQIIKKNLKTIYNILLCAGELTHFNETLNFSVNSSILRSSQIVSGTMFYSELKYGGFC